MNVDQLCSVEAIEPEKVRSLVSELCLRQERERRHIAAGIHNKLSQRLAMAKMLLSGVREQNPANQTKALGEINAMLDQAIDESRSLTFDLSPPVLYELGLGAAVEWLAEQVQRQHGVPVRVRDLLNRTTVPVDVRVLLFRSIQELLNNAVQHGRGSAILVSIGSGKIAGKAVVRAMVLDNGCGMAIKSLSDTASFGLMNLAIQFEQAGGFCEVRSEPGRGTRVRMIAPLTKEHGKAVQVA